MRSPQEYVSDMMREHVEVNAFNLHPATVAHYDQFSTDIKRAAAGVGLNTDSAGYKASVLLTCDLIDHMAQALRKTDEEDRETGACYLEEVARRLRLVSLWGEAECKETCLDLRQ